MTLMISPNGQLSNSSANSLDYGQFNKAISSGLLSVPANNTDWMKSVGNSIPTSLQSNPPQPQQQQREVPNPYTTYVNVNGRNIKIADAMGEGLVNQYGDQINAAQNDVAARESAMRDSIGKQWDEVNGYLDKVGSYLPQQYDLQGQQIDNLATGQKQQIADEQGNAQRKIEGYRGTVETNQANTLRDLAENMRNQYQAGNIYLGANGAGNSSAADRYSFALQKAGNKTRAGVLNSSNQQYTDLNMKAADIDSAAQSQANQVDTWKNDKTAELGQWYNEQKQQLDYQRANASGQKAQAIAALDANLYQTAIGRLNQIESAATTWKQSVESWKMNRQAQLQDQLAGYSQMSQYTPQAASSNLNAGISQTPSATQGNFGAGAGSTISTEDIRKGFLFGGLGN